MLDMNLILEPAALTLLSNLAALQRRHTGAIILVSPSRARAWPDSAPEAVLPVDRARLRALEAERLVMVEPYTETKPRGTQILGMTSRGWQLAERLDQPQDEVEQADFAVRVVA